MSKFCLKKIYMSNYFANDLMVTVIRRRYQSYDIQTHTHIRADETAVKIYNKS